MTVDRDELLGIEPGTEADARCWKCGDPSSEVVEGLCRNRCCVEVRCVVCATYLGGWGPVGCRCMMGGPNPLSVRYLHRRRRRR